MIKSFLVLFGSLLIGTITMAQSKDPLLEKNYSFSGASATKKSYHAIYQLDGNEPKVIEKVLRNINNVLQDPRLQGKLQIELVAFAGGTEAYMKGSKYENELKALVAKGVIVAQCGNTLKERKISRDQLYDFIGIVPSANGELIIRQSEGWAIIKP